MLVTILVVILVLALIGSIPVWPYNASAPYGFWPSGILGTILVIMLILFLLGRL